jgi:hypothetical protein
VSARDADSSSGYLPAANKYAHQHQNQQRTWKRIAYSGESQCSRTRLFIVVAISTKVLKLSSVKGR